MRARTLLLAAAFVLLTGQRCQPRERMCNDITMAVTIGQAGVLIPSCTNSGPLQFQNREVVTFPGLTDELTTAEVPQSGGFYAVLITATARAVPGTVSVTLHDVPDPNFPRVTNDYTIHVAIVGVNQELCSGSDCFDFTESPFEPSVPLTGPETLTFRITNRYIANQTGGASVSGVGFTDTLPPGLQVAAPPNAQNDCGGSFTGPGLQPPAAGDTSISLSGATLPPGGSCTLSVDVSSSQLGLFTNMTGPIHWIAPASQGGGQIDGGTASATFSVVAAAPPSLAKRFVQSTVQANAAATLAFTVSNADPTVMATGVSFTDTFPSGLHVASTPDVTNDCGGTFVGPSGQPPAGGDTTISLSGVNLGPSGTCSLSIQVSSAVPGTYVNTAAATSHEGGTGQASVAQLTVTPVGAVSLVSITVAPTAPTVLVGQTVQLTALGNYSDGSTAPLASVNWTSSSPASASVTPQGLVTGLTAASGLIITARDPTTGITGSATLNVFIPVNLLAQPQVSGGQTNADCVASGAGPFNYAWRGYQDDGTTGELTFSNPAVQAPTVTMFTAGGEGANFYLFCDVSLTSTGGGTIGSGYEQVTLSTGDTVATVIVTPSLIRAGLTSVTFDGTTSLNASAGMQWVVQYGGNVVPNSFEDYLRIPSASWTTVYIDSSPTPAPGLVETVPAADFSAPGAYRVQLTVQSSNDFSLNEGTYYFQVAP